MKKTGLMIGVVLGVLGSIFGAFLVTKVEFTEKAESVGRNHISRRDDASEEAEPGGPDPALEWRLLAWRDEKGRIPKDGITNALAQREGHLQQRPSGEDEDRPLWVSRGPQNVGGRTRSIIVHPNDQNILWTGSVGGGVWKSTDRGATWVSASQNMGNLAISSMAIDPFDPDTLYAGTGEGFFANGELQGAGIYRSTDGGSNWGIVPGTESWLAVNRISIAPNNPKVILAAVRGGVMRTDDMGVNWTLCWPGWSMDVAFNPISGNIAVAQIIDGNGDNRILYSEDSGISWSKSDLSVPGPFSRIELAWAQSEYKLFAIHGTTLPNGDPGGVVSISTNGGKSFTGWVAQTNEGFIDAGYYHNTLWISPTDANLVVFGGQTLHRSTDGGHTFVRINSESFLSDRVHHDVHCVVPDPGFDGATNKRVYVGSDGGVYYTDDITTASASANHGWHQLNHTYQTTQFYGAAGNGTTGLIFGGTQDNGSLRVLQDDKNAKIANAGGDGGFAAVDPNNSDYCYGELPALGIYRITECTSQQPDHDLIAQGIGGSTLLDVGHANFIAPFILDNNDPTGNRMFAGGFSLWRTNNVKALGDPSWAAIKGATGVDANDVISAIAVAPGNSNIVWVAQNNGKVYKTYNALARTPAWTTIDDNSALDPLPNRYVTRIVIDNDNSNVVYISLGGFSDNNLLTNEQGGAGAWTDVTGGACTQNAGLPCVPIRGIARHPNNKDKLYLGTEIGVYLGERANNVWGWTPVPYGPANVSVDEVVFMSSTRLLAATYGRGLWTTEVGAF